MKDKKDILQWIFEIYLTLVLVWVFTALSFDILMITLHFMDREDLSKQIIDKLFN